MIVTIWRHGQAGEAVTDEVRPLTTRGGEDIRTGSRQFMTQCRRRMIAGPDRILYSRWQRTTETAVLLDDAFNPGSRQSCDALIPGAGTSQVDALLEQELAAKNPALHLVLVSHQPLVSSLVNHYLGSVGRAPQLPPGGLVCMDLVFAGADGASLNWWALPPAYDANQ